MAISDFVNPVYLRHLRQSVRGKQFSWIFFGLILGGFILSLIAVQFFWPAWTISLAILIAVAALFCVVLPLSMTLSLISERNSRAHELVMITPLSAGKLVLGPYWSSLTTGLLATSALAPYLALAYLLGGVDLLALAFSLLASFLAGTFLLAFALAATAGIASKPAQSAGQLAAFLLGGALGSWIVAIFISASYARTPFRIDGMQFVYLAIFWIASLPLIATLLLLARSRFLPPESDRARAVRIGCFATLLVPFGAIQAIYFLMRWAAAKPRIGRAAVLKYYLGDPTDLMVIFFLLCLCAAVAISFLALTGELAAPRRVLKNLARRPLARALAFLTGPGAHRALLYSFACFAVLLAAADLASALRFGWLRTRPAFSYVALAAFSHLLFFTGVPLAVLELLAKKPSPALKRLVVLSFFSAVVATVNIVTALYADPALPESRWAMPLRILNPFFVIGEALEKRPEDGAIFLLTAVALVAFACWAGIALKAMCAERASLKALKEEAHAG